MSTTIEQTAAPVLTVADVVARVRNRPRAFLLPVVLGLVAAVGYVLFAPRTYVAVASVQVQPVVADQYGSVNIANVLNMATEEQVAQSSSVTGLAATALGTTPGQVQAALSVDTPQDTQVINVRYAAGNGADAARGAQTVAEKYLEFRASSTQKDTQRRIDDLNVAIASDEAKLAARPGAETGALQVDLQSLLGSRRQLVAIQTTPVGRVITAASVPSSPSSPKVSTDVPLGLAAGLIAGLGLALLLPAAEPQRTTSPARTTAPRRARDASGEPSEFDQMLLAAQAKGMNAAAFPSAAGPAPSLRVPASAGSATAVSGGGVGAGANGANGADSGDAARAVDAVRPGSGRNGANSVAAGNGPASVGVALSGTGVNGSPTNDSEMNGAASNGTGSNGAGSDGPASKDTGSDGTASDGTESNGPAPKGTGSNGTASKDTGSNGTASNGPASKDTGEDGTASNSPASKDTGADGTGSDGPAADGTWSDDADSDGASSDGSASDGAGAIAATGPAEPASRS